MFHESGMEAMRRPFLYWLPLLLWMGVVLGIGGAVALPLRTEDDVFRLLVRKGIHVGEYAVLGWLVYRALAQGSHRFRAGLALAVLLLTVGFGAVDEWRQTFIRGRSGRPLDVGIDALGAGLGLLCSLIWANRRATLADRAPSPDTVGGQR